MWSYKYITGKKEKKNVGQVPRNVTPLSGENAWDVDGISRRGVETIKVRDKSGANSCASEVSFHHTELALGAIFPFIKLNLLALYRLEFTLMRSIPINVSDNTGILEINDGIVNEESGSRGGVENVEVVIFDPRAIEIGGGVCTCMEGNRKLGITPFASSYKMSVDPNLPEGDIVCHLVLPVLVEEDEQVLSRVTTVVLAPSNSWMVWVIKLLSKLRDVGDGTGCR